MDKQLILKHALGAMRNIASCGAFGPKIDVTEEMASIELMDEEGRAITAALFAEFLARIDAERGKEAVVFRMIDGDYVEYNGIDQFSCGRTGGEPLFLSPTPTIPEGMALVPIEPTVEMIEAGNEGFRNPDSRRHTVSSCYKAMVAATGELGLKNE